MVDFIEFNEDESRFLINLASRYDHWRMAKRESVTGRLQWKGAADSPSLYRMFDGNGNGTSLGPRSPETEKLYKSYLSHKKITEDGWGRLQESSRQYNAFRLPKISAFAGAALRELDVCGYLGPVQVVGTNAIFAYQIEARIHLVEDLTATDDFDLSFTSMKINKKDDTRWPQTIFQVLKRVDSTYTINTERPFQARNTNGDEIELLLPESLTETFSARERFRPVPMMEQNWLTMGTGVSHVIYDMANKPAKIVAPDPRYFALQKMWLSKKPSRNPLKIEKDARQGNIILDLVAERMPHYPLNEEFSQTLPSELLVYFEQWKKQSDQSSRPPKRPLFP